MKIIYFILLSFLVCSCTINNSLRYDYGAAQTAKYKPYYAEKIEEGSTVINAGYNFVSSLAKNGDYVFSVYYPETKILLSQVRYKDKIMSIPTGKYQEFYWKTGVVSLEGQFDDYGNKVGKWKKYDYNTGNISNVKNYQNDKIEGEEIFYFDSTTVVSRINNFSNGELDGKSYQYTKEGVVSVSELYEKGKLVSRKNFIVSKSESDLKGETRTALFDGQQCQDMNDSTTRYNCHTNALMFFLRNTIKYPPKMREFGVQGRCIVKFTVEKDGTIDNIEIVKGISKILDEEVIRVVKAMPKWKPGIQNGRIVKSYFTLPTSFKLESYPPDPVLPRKKIYN